MNVVYTSVCTSARALSTGKITAQGVKGEEPTIEHHIDAYCVQNKPGNVELDCEKIDFYPYGLLILTKPIIIFIRKKKKLKRSQFFFLINILNILIETYIARISKEKRRSCKRSIWGFFKIKNVKCLFFTTIKRGQIN